MAGYEVRCVTQEGAQHGGTVRTVEGEVDAGMDAAFAEMAVRQCVQAVLGEQRVEVAQVGAQPGRRNGGILPAGVGQGGQTDRGQPCPVRTNSPQGGSLVRVVDDAPLPGACLLYTSPSPRD